MINCRKMTAELVPDAYEMLNRFLSEDEHYLASSQAYGDRGLRGINDALDLFLEENMEYARRLIHAGVPTELHVYPGAYHGFQMVPSAQVTQAGARDQISAIRRALEL